MSRLAATLVSGLILGVPLAVHAHDVGGLNHESAQRSLEFASSVNPSSSNFSSETRSVISRLVLWTPGSKLTACFIGGSPAVRKKIKTLAGQWTAVPGVNLSVDFGAEPGFRSCSQTAGPNGRHEDIRVGFRSAGFWSYVGIDSHHPDIGAGPSMNLQNFDMLDVARADYDFYVLHEFGHAFGMEHEHQAPGTDCSAEFDLPHIKQSLNWTDEMIARNFKPLEANSRKFEWSAYDPESIMMYSLPVEYFKKGIKLNCLVQQASKLSDEDMRAMQRAYPTKPAGQKPPSRSLDADAAMAVEGLPQSIRRRAEVSKTLD